MKIKGLEVNNEILFLFQKYHLNKNQFYEAFSYFSKITSSYDENVYFFYYYR
jgi:hypothetical protein